MRPSLVLATVAGILFFFHPDRDAGAEGSKASTAPVESTARDRTFIVEDNGPNRLLLATGATTLGFAYGISAYVAVGSARASERWLFVPVAGPWVAFARREDCADRCSVDAASKALLVADGIVQLAGVAQIALAFVRRDLRERERPIVAPMRVEGGAGLAAFGTF